MNLLKKMMTYVSLLCVVAVSVGFYCAAKDVSAKIQARKMDKRREARRRARKYSFTEKVTQKTRKIREISQALPGVEYLSSEQRNVLEKLTKEHQQLNRSMSQLKRETKVENHQAGLEKLDDFISRYERLKNKLRKK